MADLTDKTLQATLAVLAAGALVALVFVLILMRPVENVPFRDVLLVLVGVLAGVCKDVYGYYFGSSTGSKEAQATVKEMAVKSADVAAVAAAEAKSNP